MVIEATGGVVPLMSGVDVPEVRQSCRDCNWSLLGYMSPRTAYSGGTAFVARGQQPGRKDCRRG